MAYNQIDNIKTSKGFYILKINNKDYPIDEYYYGCILPYVRKILKVEQMIELIAFSNASSIIKKQYKYIFSHSISTYELKNKLLAKNVDEEHIRLIISRLKEEGLLKDQDFIDYYKEYYKQKKGKKAFKSFLIQKRINPKLIDIAIEDYDEDKDLALRYASSYIKNKTSSNIALKQKVKAMLLNKGFSENTITYVFDNLSFNDENISLKKEIKKYLTKYPNDLYKIISKLANKGYNVKDIKNILTEEGMSFEN